MGVALREDLPGAGRRCFRERARQPRGDLAVEGGGWVDGWMGGLCEWHEKGESRGQARQYCGSAWTRDAYRVYMFIGRARDDDEVQRGIDTGPGT